MIFSCIELSVIKIPDKYEYVNLINDKYSWIVYPNKTVQNVEICFRNLKVLTYIEMNSKNTKISYEKYYVINGFHIETEACKIAYKVHVQ